MFAAEMRMAAELRDDKKATKVAADEAGKLKMNVDKYKEGVSKLKKSLRTKDKELTKSANNLKKVEDEFVAARTRIQELQANLKKS